MPRQPKKIRGMKAPAQRIKATAPTTEWNKPIWARGNKPISFKQALLKGKIIQRPVKTSRFIHGEPNVCIARGPNGKIIVKESRHNQDEIRITRNIIEKISQKQHAFFELSQPLKMEYIDKNPIMGENLIIIEYLKSPTAMELQDHASPRFKSIMRFLKRSGKTKKDLKRQ